MTAAATAAAAAFATAAAAAAACAAAAAAAFATVVAACAAVLLLLCCCYSGTPSSWPRLLRAGRLYDIIRTCPVTMRYTLATKQHQQQQQQQQQKQLLFIHKRTQAEDSNERPAVLISAPINSDRYTIFFSIPFATKIRGRPHMAGPPLGLCV